MLARCARWMELDHFGIDNEVVLRTLRWQSLHCKTVQSLNALLLKNSIFLRFDGDDKVLLSSPPS
jgi:hypothetical protein